MLEEQVEGLAVLCGYGFHLVEIDGQLAFVHDIVSDKGIELCGAALGKRFQERDRGNGCPLVEHAVQQLFLRGEVVVKRRGVDARLTGDLAERSVRIPVCAEQAYGNGDDLFACDSAFRRLLGVAAMRFPVLVSRFLGHGFLLPYG